MKILANDGISALGKEKLEANGFTVVTDNVPQDQLIAAINAEGYVGLLVRSATTARKELIDACPNLKFIGRGGVGMDNIDVAYGREKGLRVQNTPAASSDSVAELVIGQMYSCARNLHDSNRLMPQQGAEDFKGLKKKYAKGIELAGKTLGIIGFGRIGQATAKRALGAGMRVVAYDRSAALAELELNIHGAGKVTAKVDRLEMKDLLASSDFISLHVPKQADGSAVITKAEFDQMKPGVNIVNASRGGLVDEDALLEALDSGKLNCVALDVFENEPNPRAELLKHPKIASTPHIGAATLEAQDRIGIELADHIIEYFA